ncbi:MAG: hypothetical protein QXL15_02990 [Candidatus Korarchaeota archaeon]
MKVKIVPALSGRAILHTESKEFNPGDAILVTTDNDSYAVVLGDVKKDSSNILVVPKSIANAEAKGEISKIDIPNASSIELLVNAQVPESIVRKEVLGKVLDLGQRCAIVVKGKSYSSILEVIAFNSEPEFPVRVVEETKIRVMVPTSPIENIIDDLKKRRAERIKRLKEMKLFPTVKEELLKQVSTATPIQRDVNLFMLPGDVQTIIEAMYPSFKLVKEQELERGKVISYFDEKGVLATLFFKEGGKNTLLNIVIKSLDEGEKLADEIVSLLIKNDPLYRYKNLCPQCGARLEWQDEIPNEKAESFVCSFCGSNVEITTAMRDVLRVMKK